MRPFHYSLLDIKWIVYNGTQSDKASNLRINLDSELCRSKKIPWIEGNLIIDGAKPLLRESILSNPVFHTIQKVRYPCYVSKWACFYFLIKPFTFPYLPQKYIQFYFPNPKIQLASTNGAVSLISWNVPAIVDDTCLI